MKIAVVAYIWYASTHVEKGREGKKGMCGTAVPRWKRKEDVLINITELETLTGVLWVKFGFFMMSQISMKQYAIAFLPEVDR